MQNKKMMRGIGYNMTPVVLFVFNRPNTTHQVISALSAQTIRPSRLIVFSDGARDLAEETKVKAVRDLIRSIDWATVQMHERKCNWGCAKNIIEGLTEVFKEYPQAVIIEDDVLPASHAYESLLLLLDHYASECQVFSVGGYPSIAPDALPDYQYDVILSPRFSVWGWGTWADRWQSILSDLHDFKSPFKSLEDVPTHAGTDLAAALQQIQERPGFYWDLPIALLCLHRGLLHALTRYYLINNLGLSSGTHGSASPKVLDFFARHNAISERLPALYPPVFLQEDICQAIQQYLKAAYSAGQDNRITRPQPVLSLLKRIVTKLLHLFLSRREPRPDPKAYSTICGKGSIVPCQIEAYFLALNKYVEEGDTILDVGFGLGYGLNILAIKAKKVSGVEIDYKVYKYCQDTIVGRNPRLVHLKLYDGYNLPFPDNYFNVVTCVDVLEHVEDYHMFIEELLRVSSKGVFISTPNRRPEYTNPDGTPKNHWHLREWSRAELDEILRQHGTVEWNFLNGPYDGPFTWTGDVADNTLTLSPFVYKKVSGSDIDYCGRKL